MAGFINSIINKSITRRTFVAASAVGTAGLALAGCGGNSLTALDGDKKTYLDQDGKWIAAGCWHNCGARCLNKALVVDGIVVRQKSDDTHADSQEFPQQRACLRGRAQQQQIYNAGRIKYPMKRKHWEPGGGDKSLRGRDTWERISWDEALDYVAAEFKKAKEQYGPRSIFTFTDLDVPKVLHAYGGAATVWDTTSLGTYLFPWANIGMLSNGMQTANDRLDLYNSDVIIMHGANPAWSYGGNVSFRFLDAKKNGAEMVYVGPTYNATAAMLDARWIPVRSGTDIPLLLAIAYVLITEDDPISNPMLDWDYIKRYTLGFSEDTMPADAKINENFKDYVLGKYDGIPKTPEWATEICGTPIEDIKYYARIIRKDNKVAMLHAFAPARNTGAEDFPQLFATLGFITGHVGKPGHACGNTYKTQSNSGPVLAKYGSDGLPKIKNPVDDSINAPTLWRSILEGRYRYNGHRKWLAEEMRDIDIRVVQCDVQGGMGTKPDMEAGIRACREKLDFVVTQHYTFNMQAMYSDIILPVTTMWERIGGYTTQNQDKESVFFFSQVIEPMFEAKTDQWIAIEIAKRLGLNPEEIFPFDEKQQFFNVVASSQVMLEDGKTYGPLATITEADIKEWGVVGEPQVGKIGIKELLELGMYQVPRHKDDNYGYIAYEKFIKDPENNPLTSKSGKFDIYSDWKADTLNATGMADMKFKPYPSYIVPPEGYEKTFSDFDKKIKGEFPYVINNVHYPRRTHSCLDNLSWLREAFINPLFISRHDAEELGIKTGDTVLITSATAKTLRQANVSEFVMPGVVELPHGSWIDFDETLGIDLGGSDSFISGPLTSNSGVSGYNNHICNIEKYNGAPLVPDYLKPLPAAKEA